nr:E3 ubiquitin-protein ligase PDZRN3-B-like [Dermacentor andersoni]
MTDGWTYTLTGFGEFLEMRRVSFAEPMPAARLCGVCGLLPCRTLQLPCGHVFCESCKAQTGRGDSCPFDGKKFADSEVHSMSMKRFELEQCRFVCAAGSRFCGFVGKLSELGDHLTRCGGGETRCGKCQRPVFRSLAVDHYRRCTVGTPVAANAEADSKGVADVAKTEIETPRELMLSKGVDLEAVFRCFTNALAEKVASLECQLLEVQKKSTSEQQSSLAAAKPATVIQGPFRAASRGGVLITTCKFDDVYAELDSLDEKKKELTKSTDTYSLGGYTFKLDCEFSKDENEMNVRFILFLRSGEWDAYVEWPFKKKVTLIIMHPRNKAKDVRLPVTMDEHKMVKKPEPDAYNWGRFTDEKNWKDIERQGYVEKGALYVNVEFADMY